MKNSSLLLLVLLFLLVRNSHAYQIQLEDGTIVKYHVKNESSTIELTSCTLINVDSESAYSIAISHDSPLFFYSGSVLLDKVEQGESAIEKAHDLVKKGYDTLVLHCQERMKVELSPLSTIKQIEQQPFAKQKEHYGLTITILIYLVFLTYLQFHNPMAGFYFFNPRTLLRFNVVEPIFSVKFLAFPNVILVVFNAVILGIIFARTFSNAYDKEVFNYITLFILIMTLKSILTSIVNSFLDAKDLNKVVHVDFTRILGMYTVITIFAYCETLFLWSTDFSTLLVWLSILFYLWWLLRIILLLRSESEFRIFHFFSYLCILEIVPFLFLAIKLAD